MKNTSKTSAFRAKALRKEVGSMARENTCALILVNTIKNKLIRLIWPKQSLIKEKM